MRKIGFKPFLPYLGYVLILAGIYVGTAMLGLPFAFIEKQVTLVWPPTGIALVAILLFGYRLWPGLSLGVIIFDLLTDAPPGFLLATAIGNPLAAIVGAYLLQHWIKFHNELDRVKDVLGLMFAAGAGSLFSATIGTLSLCFSGLTTWPLCGSAWLRWFIGDTLGVIMLAPALLMWLNFSPSPLRKNPRCILEIGALTMLVIVTSLSVYGGWLPQKTTHPLSYIIFPLAIWAALRFGTRAVSTIVLYWTVAAIWGTSKGLGPFTEGSMAENLAHLDFTIILTISLLLLSAVITERKQAQSTLRESEERYRLLVEHSPEAIFVHTGNKTVFVNPACLQLLAAADPGQLLGKPPLDFLHPDYTGSVLEQLQQLLVEKKPVPLSEEKFIRFDGVLIDVEVASIPITFQGKPAIQMVARDITARKRAEEALRVSEARFRELSDAAEEGLAIHHQGTILEANEALARMFGYPLRELIGMYAEKMATPETWEIIKKHIAEGYNKPYEGIGIRKDGSHFWCQMVGKPYTHHGKLLRLAIFRDITEQKLAEEAKKISERRYQRLFESAMDGLLIMDADTAMIIDINPSLEKMLAYPRGEFIGKKIWEIQPLKNMKSTKPAFDKMQTDGYLHYEHLPVENSSGRHMDVEFVCNVFQENHNKVIVCNIRDITTRKQAEEKMRQAQMVIAKTSELKNQFLTSISHEIRTPMNSILGFAQLLDEMIVEKQNIKEKGTTEEKLLEDNVRENLQREYINAIKSCSEVLINLLNDILDYKKIEAGKLELQYEFFTPHSIFAEMKQIFMPKIKDKKLELLIKIDPALPATIFLDKLRLRQILFNLISNAIKFTIRGFIKLELQKIGNGDDPETCDLLFLIQDTGIGISKEQLETIFEAFSQKKGQDIGLFGGTGLGLTISKHLAQLMNGVIRVESEEGKGSVFKVLFEGVKVGTGLEITDVLIKEDNDTTKFDNITILIADDNNTNRTLKKQFFKSSLAHFIEAANGQKAVELARQYKPDLIIMDLKMPIMNGPEAAQIIKNDEELRDIPIIAETSSEIENSEIILKMGFDGFLQGPYDRSQLIKELLRFLPRIVEKQLSRKTDIDNSEGTYKLGNIPQKATAKLPELISILKNELTIPWNHIRDTFILDEIDLFVKRILKLAEIYDMPVLTEWGNDVKNLAESCEMEKLMATLDYFPGLVKQVEVYLENQEGKDG